MGAVGWVPARTDAGDRGAGTREDVREGFGVATRGSWTRSSRARTRGAAESPARAADRYPRDGGESDRSSRGRAHLVDRDPDAREHDEQEREALDGRAPRTAQRVPHRVRATAE